MTSEKTPPTSDPRPQFELLRQMFAEAMDAMQPAARFLEQTSFTKSMLRLPDGHEINLNSYRNVWVFGAGKGAFSLAEGMIQLLGKRLAGGAVIGPVSALPQPDATHTATGVYMLPGDHPVPGEHSLRSTEKLIEIAREVRADDLVLFALTGGASAMLAKPAPGVTMEHKRQRFRELLASGASIAEMNRARKQLSAVKGGRLLEAFNGADVVNFVISDVPGNDLQTIGSAPTQPPHNAASAASRQVYNVMLATPEQNAAAIARKARAKGIRSYAMNAAFSGAMENLVAMIVGDLESELRNRGQNGDTPPTLRIYFGEADLKVGPAAGKGGRNTHLALMLADPLHRLAQTRPGTHITLLSAGTDGIDGNTPAAGAICTEQTALLARKMNLDTAEYLTKFDSYTYFSQIDAIFQPGPTGTNLTDLQLILIH